MYIYTGMYMFFLYKYVYICTLIETGYGIQKGLAVKNSNLNFKF